MKNIIYLRRRPGGSTSSRRYEFDWPEVGFSHLSWNPAIDQPLRLFVGAGERICFYLCVQQTSDTVTVRLRQLSQPAGQAYKLNGPQIFCTEETYTWFRRAARRHGNRLHLSLGLWDKGVDHVLRIVVNVHETRSGPKLSLSHVSEIDMAPYRAWRKKRKDPKKGAE